MNLLRCYLTDTEKSYLILEDLSVTGYKNVDKKIGLTFDCYKSLYSTLAKWHAATSILFHSVSLNNFEVLFNNFPNYFKEPTIMKMFTDPFYTTFQDIVRESITNTVAKLICNEPEFKNISSKLEKLSTTVSQRVSKSLKRCSNEFNCLNHNDLWTNNIMFHELTNNALLIDFQLAYLGSPVIDVCKSLFQSSHNDIRSKEFDELLIYYHNELNSTLIKLQCTNIPSLYDLNDCIRTRGISAMTSALFGTVSRHLLDVDLVYSKLFADNSDAKMIDLEIFMNPDAKDKLWFLINYFDEMGYFD